jgi:hypothetical protein
MLIIQICLGILLAKFILFLLKIETVSQITLVLLFNFVLLGLLVISKPESFNSLSIVQFYSTLFGK